jgi:DNA-binding NtrC family response regulator
MPPGIAKILVVDDEPALLESMRSYLSRLGHMVTAFRSATSAWEYFAANPFAFSVVIIDMTLDGMTGAELIREVLDRNPEIAVLATSGYPWSLENLGVRHGVRLERLQKPFTPRMLVEALEHLLSPPFP